jgi:hypothetical protein
MNALAGPQGCTAQAASRTLIGAAQSCGPCSWFGQQQLQGEGGGYKRNGTRGRGLGLTLTAHHRSVPLQTTTSSSPSSMTLLTW